MELRTKNEWVGSEVVAGLLYRHKTSMLKVRDASHLSVSLDGLWHGQAIFSCWYFGILSSLANINLLTSAKGVCMMTDLMTLHKGMGRSRTTGMDNPTLYKRQEGESEAWTSKNSLAFRQACSVLALIHKDKLQVADLYATCNLPLWTSTFTNM